MVHMDVFWEVTLILINHSITYAFLLPQFPLIFFFSEAVEKELLRQQQEEQAFMDSALVVSEDMSQDDFTSVPKTAGNSSSSSSCSNASDPGPLPAGPVDIHGFMMEFIHKNYGMLFSWLIDWLMWLFWKLILMSGELLSWALNRAYIFWNEVDVQTFLPHQY